MNVHESEDEEEENNGGPRRGGITKKGEKGARPVRQKAKKGGKAGKGALMSKFSHKMLVLVFVQELGVEFYK